MAARASIEDPYRTLGILRGADIRQIKAAHRRLAKRFHPDGSMGDDQRFMAVQEAYQLLSDPLRRREWDRRHVPSREAAPGPRAAPRAGDGPGPRPAAGPRTAPGARTPRARTTTWSAEQVPWWEDFSRPLRRGTPAPNADPAPAAPTIDFDVFSRSSGAAWSMAARRHFRRGDAELPSRGAWRYRGTQVVTGAEARKVAAEEAAQQAAHEASARQTAPQTEAQAPRQTAHPPADPATEASDPQPSRTSEE